MSALLHCDVVCDSADRDAWARMRTTGIGASEMAALLGESPWASALSVYLDKTRSAPTPEQTEAQFWGLKLERTIAEVYEERTGRPTPWSGLMLRSQQYPWLTCTLDATTALAGTTHFWPLDCKTASAFKADDWSEGAPREYYLQLQHQMIVTGAERATIACLLGGQRLVWCDVARDEVEQRRIIHMSRIFWERCVLPRVPPAPDGSEASKRALLELYPEATQATVRLGEEFEEPYAELSELKRQRKAIDAQIDALENRFKAVIGSASCGVLPSRAAVSWCQRKGNVSYKAAVESVGLTPAQLEKFRGPSTRVFTLKDPR